MSSLCSLSREITLKNNVNINNNQYVTISLVPKLKIESEVNNTVQFFKSRSSTQILSFIDYFRTVTETNSFVTALGTNGIIVFQNYPDITGFFSTPVPQPVLYSSNLTGMLAYCGSVNTPTSAVILPLPLDLDNWVYGANPVENITFVKGFFTGCIPLESILQTTLDCLYEIDCLQLLIDNFPSFTQVCFIILYINLILLV